MTQQEITDRITKCTKQLSALDIYEGPNSTRIKQELQIELDHLVALKSDEESAH